MRCCGEGRHTLPATSGGRTCPPAVRHGRSNALPGRSPSHGHVPVPGTVTGLAHGVTELLQIAARPGSREASAAYPGPVPGLPLTGGCLCGAVRFEIDAPL